MILEVAIGGPEDAAPAKESVRKLIDTINNDRVLRAEGIQIHPFHWNPDVHSQIRLNWDGQSETSAQGFEDADVVVVVFKSRLGVWTKGDRSGSVKELTDAAKAGQSLHVYFFDGDDPDADPDELSELRAFRAELYGWAKEGRLGGVPRSWTDPQDLWPDLDNALRHHIQIKKDQELQRSLASGDFARWLADQPWVRDARHGGFLDYYSRQVPFCGREAEMAALRRFCDCDDLVSWWAVTGPGGTGKSRLVFQLCDELRGQGWDARFVREEFFEKSFENWDSPNDTLLVFDYAMGRAADIGAWLDRDSVGQRHHRLRVLLLERESTVRASGSPPWFSYLDQKQQRYVLWDRQYSMSQPALELDRLDDDDMVSILTSLNGADDGAIPDKDARQMVRHLGDAIDPEHKRVLFLLFLAQAYVDDPGSDWCHWDQAGLQRHIYDREQGFLLDRIQQSHRFATTATLTVRDSILDLWAFSTAVGGVKDVNACADVPTVARALVQIAPHEHELFVKQLRDYCGSDSSPSAASGGSSARSSGIDGSSLHPTAGTTQPVNTSTDIRAYTPDIAGEYFTLQRVANMSAHDRAQFVTDCWATGGLAYVDFLRRAIADYWVAEGSGSPAPSAPGAAADPAGSALELLIDQPQNTVEQPTSSGKLGTGPTPATHPDILSIDCLLAAPDNPKYVTDYAKLLGHILDLDPRNQAVLDRLIEVANQNPRKKLLVRTAIHHLTLTTPIEHLELSHAAVKMLKQRDNRPLFAPERAFLRESFPTMDIDVVEDFLLSGILDRLCSLLALRATPEDRSVYIDIMDNHPSVLLNSMSFEEYMSQKLSWAATQSSYPAMLAMSAGTTLRFWAIVSAVLPALDCHRDMHMVMLEADARLGAKNPTHDLEFMHAFFLARSLQDPLSANGVHELTRLLADVMVHNVKHSLIPGVGVWGLSGALDALLCAAGRLDPDDLTNAYIREASELTAHLAKEGTDAAGHLPDFFEDQDDSILSNAYNRSVEVLGEDHEFTRSITDAMAEIERNRSCRWKRMLANPLVTRQTQWSSGTGLGRGSNDRDTLGSIQGDAERGISFVT